MEGRRGGGGVNGQCFLKVFEKETSYYDDDTSSSTITAGGSIEKKRERVRKLNTKERNRSGTRITALVKFGGYLDMAPFTIHTANRFASQTAVGARVHTLTHTYFSHGIATHKRNNRQHIRKSSGVEACIRAC